MTVVRRSPACRWRRLLPATLTLALALPAAAMEVRVTWIGDRSADSMLITSGLLAFHDGSVDFFDHDRAPGALLAQTVPAMQGLGLGQLQETLRQTHAPAEFRVFVSAPHPITQGAISPVPPRYPRRDLVVLALQPGAHDFLSFLIPVQPSNDAFVGNEDPQRYRLFDAAGRFTGPFHIDLYGPEALDAGLCDNDEADLIWLDRGMGGGSQACTGGEGTVRPHPGLNGSQRNPDGMPVRVLGGSSSFGPGEPLHFDPVAADFTRPGRWLGRLLVGRVSPRSSPSGSWYSPARAGEGFSLQVLAPAAPGGPARALVYWYTYAPDGSGRQVWLTGLGDFVDDVTPTARIDLHSTGGGRFAATSNPSEVVATPWGELTLGLVADDRIRVGYQPTQAGYPAGQFDVHRLGPPPEGLDGPQPPAVPDLPRPDTDLEAP